MKYSIISLIFLIFISSSCVQNKALFYWGDYSNTLYDYKKTPNDETLRKHIEALQDIIDKSNEKNKKVPPGIYCEYGYILTKEGKKDKAIKYFELEANTYPESADFINKLIANL